MGQRYLIDSNLVIDYAASLLPQRGLSFLEKIFNYDFLISIAVKIEVLGFDDIPENLSAMEEFLGTATVLPLNDKVAEQTILLRRKYKKLKLGDAIIAATAIVYDLTLATHNINDFKNIKELTFIDPYTL